MLEKVEQKIIKLANKIALSTNYKGKIIWDKSKPDGTQKKLMSKDEIRMESNY